MDLKDQEHINNDRKLNEKTKVKTHITKEVRTGPTGEVLGGTVREETDIKRSADSSLKESIGEKVKGAGHVVSAVITDGARKIGLHK